MNGKKYQVVVFEGGHSVLDIATDNLQRAKDRILDLQERDCLPAIVADMSDSGRVIAGNSLYYV